MAVRGAGEQILLNFRCSCQNLYTMKCFQCDYRRACLLFNVGLQLKKLNLKKDEMS